MEIGNVAGDHRQFAGDRLDAGGIAFDQGARIGMLRPIENLENRPLLHDLAGIEHDDAVADFGDGTEIVRDEEDRTVQFLTQFAQELQDLRLERHVERGGDLIGDQEFRFLQEAHGDADALAHAAGKLSRKARQLLDEHPGIPTRLQRMRRPWRAFSGARCLAAILDVAASGGRCCAPD